MTAKGDGIFPGYSGLLQQMAFLDAPPLRSRIKLRGRPPRQPDVIAIFRDRLRAGATEQVWMRERRQIERAWSSAHPPSDRTIKRAIGTFYKRLEWRDGKVTGASALNVLNLIAGQK